MRALANLWSELAESSQLAPDLVGPSPPDQPSDLAMACFGPARQAGRPAGELARQLAGELAGRPEFKSVAAAGGYVNLSLESKFLAGQLAGLDVPACLPPPPSPRPVVIEYCSVNLAKPMSAGHLRNILLGRALTNLHRFAGWRVITDNHIGDWGRIFGIWVAGFLRYSDDGRLGEGGIDELGRIYVAASRDLEQDPDLADEIQSWLLRLQDGDREALAYHQRFSRISLGHVDRILALFGVEFDHVLGESFYQPQIGPLIDRLVDQKQARAQADGSVIIDLAPAGIKTPLLVRKSNGGYLYASSDIATLKWREDNWQPRRVIYVVGADQKFHFRQLFAANRQLKLTRAELIHYAHGLIQERSEQGGRQKMSSRAGAVNLAAVIDRARSTVKSIVKPAVSQPDQERIVFGALAFLEFSHGHSTNILFDWQSIFNLRGRSGPYVQYAVVRLNSILAKAGVDDPRPDFDNYDWQAEHEILVRLMSYPDILAEALEELEPSRIANHVWLLGRQFNRYYEQVPVLTAPAPARDSRLWLIGLAAGQMTQALELLGIDIPGEM